MCCPAGKRALQALALQGKTGVTQVMLKTDAKNPAKAVVTITAKRWFAAAAANGTQADTKLTVTIGTQCFTHVATSKRD